MLIEQSPDLSSERILGRAESQRLLIGQVEAEFEVGPHPLMRLFP